jgi:hypothetical protein
MKAESSMGSAEYAEYEATIAIEAITAHVLIGFTRVLELAVAGQTRLWSRPAAVSRSPLRRDDRIDRFSSFDGVKWSA